MKNVLNHALIMAAGRGLRMMPLTAIVPKPMAPYNGSTLIASSIKSIQSNIKKIHITVGYKGALLAEHVLGIGISSIFDTNDKGNSWWIYNTLMQYLDEPVLVMTADNIAQLNYPLLLGNYIEMGRPACMVVPVKPVDGLDGDYVHHNSGVVTKLDRSDPSDIYCSGIQILNPAKIIRLTTPSENFTDVWSQLILKQELHCSEVYPEKWISVDTVQQLNNIETAS